AVFAPFLVALSGQQFGWCSLALVCCVVTIAGVAMMAPPVAMISWGAAWLFAVLSRAALRRRRFEQTVLAELRAARSTSKSGTPTTVETPIEPASTVVSRAPERYPIFPSSLGGPGWIERR
ncbi:hypothetical protein, partial [Rhodoplanes sp. SY1]|uniref:hypothetical protein n=1 Tax=Rhodoplanes sp. SY1 TaxID=3166646 RepID=UPI0038B5A999